MAEPGLAPPSPDPKLNTYFSPAWLEGKNQQHRRQLGEVSICRGPTQRKGPHCPVPGVPGPSGSCPSPPWQDSAQLQSAAQAFHAPPSTAAITSGRKLRGSNTTFCVEAGRESLSATEGAVGTHMTWEKSWMRDPAWERVCVWGGVFPLVQSIPPGGLHSLNVTFTT